MPKFDISATKKLNKNSSTEDRARDDKAEEEEKFLQKALSICERFVQLPKIFFSYLKFYKVAPADFVQHVSQIRVEISRWSECKDKRKPVALSWTNKYKIHRIFINSFFWDRFCLTTNEEEKERIVFLVAISILHELAHLSLQWSYDFEYISIFFFGSLNIFSFQNY